MFNKEPKLRMKSLAIIIISIIIFPVYTLGQDRPMDVSEADTTVILQGVEILASDQQHPYVQPIAILQLREMQSNPTSDAATLLKSISNVGGVRKGPVTLDPVVRGFRAGQLNVQLNGGMLIEGGCPNRMDPTSSHVSADRIAAIQVFKGPYTLRYGPNMGGVVRLLTKEPEVKEKAHLEAEAAKRMETNWNANTEAAEVSWHAPHFAATAHAGRSKYNDYTSGSGEIVSAAFDKYHYGTALRYQTEKHRITITADGSHGYDVHYPALPMDERSDDTWFARAAYQYTPTNDVFKNLDINIYHSRVHHVMDNKERPFSDTVAAVSDIHTTAQGYRLEAMLKPGNATWYIGSDGSYITKDGMRTKNMILQPPVNGKIPVKKEALWNDAQTINLGLFTELSRRYNNWFWIVAGRLDYNMAGSDTISILRPGNPEPWVTAKDNTESAFLNYSFSGGLTRFFNHDLSLGLSLGRAMRSPDMTERFIIMLPVGYDSYDYLGNPDLKPEVNHEADLTLKKKISNAGSLSAGFFFSWVSDYITAIRISELPLTADVLGVKQFVNGEKALLYGYEISWEGSKKSIIGIRWNAALSRGEIFNIEKTILDEYGQVTGTEILEKDALAEIPPFETNLMISLQKPEYKILPVLHLRYAAPQKHVSEAYYEQPSEGFFLINAHIKYSPVEGISLIAGAKNILNTNYYEHLNRRIIGTSVDMPEPGRVWYVQLNLQWK